MTPHFRATILARCVPTFAYWKGMIEPRRSDGLFDLTDIFTTSLGLAGSGAPPRARRSAREII